MASIPFNSKILDAEMDDPNNARERSRLDTMSRLADSAERLFSENGFNATKPSDIAKNAGVAIGTLYFHFQDKEGLLKEILYRGFVRLHADLRRITESGYSSVEESVRAHSSALVNFADSNTQACLVMFGPEVEATIVGQAFYEYLAKEQLERLVEGIENNFFRNDICSKIATQSVLGMLIRTIRWWINDKSRATKEEIVDTLTKLRLCGLHKAQR